jgi:flagellin-like protein
MKVSDKKGISPLVATVLLVSITMAAAIIIASWANVFLGQKKTEFEDFTETEKECRFGNMRFLEDLKHDGNTFTAIVENTGRVPLSGFALRIIPTSGNPVNSTISGAGTLTPGNFLILNHAWTGTPKIVRVITQCQDVYLEKSFV